MGTFIVNFTFFNKDSNDGVLTGCIGYNADETINVKFTLNAVKNMLLQNVRYCDKLIDFAQSISTLHVTDDNMEIVINSDSIVQELKSTNTILSNDDDSDSDNDNDAMGELLNHMQIYQHDEDVNIYNNIINNIINIDLIMDTSDHINITELSDSNSLSDDDMIYDEVNLLKLRDYYTSLLPKIS